MNTVFGYGEDALTLWLLKTQRNRILKKYEDKTSPSDCLAFYRPSFGRSTGLESAEFGEFDAIMASKEKIYLIESKWDNHRSNNKTELILRREQVERHEVFRWYLSNRESGKQFIAGKKVAPPNSLLAANLQHIISQLLKWHPTLRGLIMSRMSCFTSMVPSQDRLTRPQMVLRSCLWNMGVNISTSRNRKIDVFVLI